MSAYLPINRELSNFGQEIRTSETGSVWRIVVKATNIYVVIPLQILVQYFGQSFTSKCVQTLPSSITIHQTYTLRDPRKTKEKSLKSPLLNSYRALVWLERSPCFPLIVSNGRLPSGFFQKRGNKPSSGQANEFRVISFIECVTESL